MWNISTCLLNKNSTQNFKRSIGSGSHPQNARETGGRSYRFPFCTKIRGLLAVQIGASLPSAPWGVWCQQNVFCSQKFTSLSLCLMFNLLWIRNINMLLFLFNVSNKNAKKTNKQLPWCSFRNADFSTLRLRFMIFQHKTTHQAKTSESFCPPTTVLGSFTNGGNWQGGAVSCVFPLSWFQRMEPYTGFHCQASFNLMFVILSPGSMKIGSSGMSKIDMTINCASVMSALKIEISSTSILDTFEISQTKQTSSFYHLVHTLQGVLTENWTP